MTACICSPAEPTPAVGHAEYVVETWPARGVS